METKPEVRITDKIKVELNNTAKMACVSLNIARDIRHKLFGCELIVNKASEQGIGGLFYELNSKAMDVNGVLKELVETLTQMNNEL